MSESSSKVCLNDFQLVKVLGRGSYGKVMLVHHKKDPSQAFAMKILRKEDVVKRNQIQHTKTERNVLQHITHPFIVNLMFAFQTPRTLYFVLEYCVGGELFFHLSRERQFSEGKCRFYASELLLAIQHLHSRDIIYRDLKPENVLFGHDGHVKLTDFGLSKEGIKDNYSAKSMCGTPEYLAPEIISKRGHGKAVDWYSLGAIIFEMLTGLPPFYTDKRDDLFNCIQNAKLEYPKHISAVAKSLCQALLCRDPAKRLGTDPKVDVKSHEFWGKLDWEAVLNKKIEPPFKPDVSSKSATKYFEQHFLDLPVVNSGEGGTAQKDPLPINGFTYQQPAIFGQA